MGTWIYGIREGKAHPSVSKRRTGWVLGYGEPAGAGGFPGVPAVRAYSGGGSSFLGPGKQKDGVDSCSKAIIHPVFFLVRALEAAPPELSVLWPAARMNPLAAAASPQDKARPGPLRGRLPPQPNRIRQTSIYHTSFPNILPPMVPSGIFTPKFSAMVAPTAANVSVSSSLPAPSNFLE